MRYTFHIQVLQLISAPNSTNREDLITIQQDKLVVSGSEIDQTISITIKSAATSLSGLLHGDFSGQAGLGHQVIGTTQVVEVLTMIVDGLENRSDLMRYTMK